MHYSHGDIRFSQEAQEFKDAWPPPPPPPHAAAHLQRQAEQHPNTRVYKSVWCRFASYIFNFLPSLKYRQETESGLTSKQFVSVTKEILDVKDFFHKESKVYDKPVTQLQA